MKELGSEGSLKEFLIRFKNSHENVSDCLPFSSTNYLISDNIAKYFRFKYIVYENNKTYKIEKTFV